MAKHQANQDYEVLEHLRKMPELKLHTEIVIPLLRAMNFKIVRYLHGPNEQGKDILYVATDNFGKDYIGVCQVKNQPFSGHATSPSHTIGVLNQLKQCCSIEVHSPVTGTNELPEEIVLLSTYPIPNKDVVGARDLLAELKRSRCKLLEPETLIRLIKTKIPQIYARFTSSGKGLAKEISTYVNIHHEAAAFGIHQKRELSEFYVELGFANPSAHQLDVDDTEATLSIENERIKIKRWLYDDIIRTLAILPPELCGAKVIEIVGSQKLNPWHKDEMLEVKELSILNFVRHARRCVQELCSRQEPNYLERAILLMRATQWFVLFLLKHVPDNPRLERKSDIIDALQAMKIPEVSPEARIPGTP